MLESVSAKDKLAFADLTEEEKQKRGILGRLYGPCADIINSTRNGRKYSDELWEKVFKQPLVEELFKNGGIPGEIDHPTDRSETDSSRIAIMLPEKPKKDDSGKLIAYFDILNTPCGQIAYQLAKYGFKWGVSSRGEGDITEDYATGEAIVDPDTYTLNAFDLVLIPSVEQARLNMITEGMDNNTALKKALKESFDKASAGDKEIMADTLKDLNIGFNGLTLNEDLSTVHGVLDNSKAVATDTVDNVKVSDVVKSLQESVKQTQTLQKQVKMLQEKLSVCNTKEAKLIASVQRSSDENKELRESLKKMSAQMDELKNKLTSSDQQLTDSKKLVESQNKRIELLMKRCDSHLQARKSMNEALTQTKSSNASLVEGLQKDISDRDSKISELTESLANSKQNLLIKEREYSAKVTKANKLAESYMGLAKNALNRYIDNKAKGMGVMPYEIKRRLSENFTIDDVDKICDELMNTKLSLTDLPFDIKPNCKLKITESNEKVFPKSEFNDEIDEQLKSISVKYV